MPGARFVFSTLEHDFLRPLLGDGMLGDADDLVVTFDGFTREAAYPASVQWMLKTLEKAYGCPVDIEFAGDGDRLYLLQCRPQAVRRARRSAPVPGRRAAPNVASSRPAATSTRARSPTWSGWWSSTRATTTPSRARIAGSPWRASSRGSTSGLQDTGAN